MPTIFESRKNSHATSHLQPNTINKSFHRYLHAFCFNPKIGFESQHEDEQVILLLRAHPITQIPWIIASIVLFFVPLLITFFLHAFASPSQIIFTNFVWYSFLFSYIFINILNYIFNVGLITNHRIVDIDYHYVLYKEINQTTFNKIEDVTSKTGGFIRSLLHYGDIFVQTAGAEANIEFYAVPDPTEVATIINRIMRGENII